nr:hypothetical protein [uncultured Flavobacterium sp.]
MQKNLKVLSIVLALENLIFRTPYGPGFIVISQSIANALQRESWEGLLLQPTEHYTGV